MSQFSDDDELCCGVLNMEAGQSVIGMIMVGITSGMIYMAFYYEHFIFFTPLVFICSIYSIFFLWHKIVPGKDNEETRRVLFFMMAFMTVGSLAYGFLFANEIFNNVPAEVCEQNIYMDKKVCIAWLTGLPGNLFVIIWTFTMLYFTYVHLNYLNIATEKSRAISEFDSNNPYYGRR